MITGASSGIGRALAVHLAARGARVLLACRSAESVDGVIAEVASLPGGGCAEHVELDLADLGSVRSCARALAVLDDPLYALVNNAGIAGQRGVTAQGFELAFGVNHLGHFLLTVSLLDRLGFGCGSRIVNVSSQAHFGAKDVDFDAVRRPTRTWTGVAEYQVSKLCNVLFTQELARRLRSLGVSTCAVHPGFVATNIWRRRPPWPYRSVYADLLTTPERGAETTWSCLGAPHTGVSSGAYFEEGQAAAPSPVATRELALDLWQHSETWTAPFR